MMTRTAPILLVAFCYFTPAFSQDAPAGSSAQSQPSQAQIDASVELLKANGSATNSLVMLDTILPIQAEAIKRDHPGADPAIIAKLLDVVRTTIVSHQEDILKIAAISYAEHFSVDELHTLTAFYRSETGQKYIRTVPSMLKEITPLTVNYVQKLVVTAIQDAVAKMRAQGVKI